MLDPAVLAAVAAAAPPAVVGILVAIFHRRRRDEVFTGVTPGEIPGLGHSAETTRVRGSEWDGPIAPRFTPPDGVAPGLAGTVIDGRCDLPDLTATLVSLALRGHLEIKPVTGDGPASSADRPTDWRLIRRHPDPDLDTEATGPATSSEPLAAHEAAVLAAFLGGRDEVLLSTLKRPEFVTELRAAQIAFYREVVDRGWYLRHPRSRNSRLRTLGILGLVGSTVLLVVEGLRWSHGTAAPWLPALAAGLLTASGLLVWLGRGRTPRTASGTAVRIQALGFRRYLATAEANQIRAEEAAQVFSRYLPYAVAFGVAEHWASIVGEVARAAQLHHAGAVAADVALDLIADPYTFDLVLDLTGEIAGGLINLADHTDLGALLDGLDGVDGVDLDGIDLGAVFSGVGDAVTSLGESIGDLDVGGWFDGCDGCDGCSLDV